MKIAKQYTTLMLIASTVVLFSCSGRSTQINQSEVCIVTSYIAKENVAICETGSKIMFLPERFGNEQLPILFTGTNCDHRFHIAMSNGGVSCIFKPITDIHDGKQSIAE